MAAPAQPYIDVVTGTVYGDIKVNGSFSWYNSGTSNSCDVTGVGNWCTSSEYKNIGTDSSMGGQVKAAPLQPGTYYFTSTGHPSGNPSVSIHAQHK